jgi:ATP-binding cassette subfamily C protein CydD
MKLDKRLLRPARAVRAILALTVGLGWLAGILLVFQARYLSQLVNGVTLEGQSLDQVRWLFLFLLVLSLVRAGVSWSSTVSANRVAVRVKTDLRQRLTAHLLALGPAYAHGERTGELTNTVVEGVEALDAYFSQYLSQLALAVLVPLTVLAFAFRLDPLSGLILLLTAPIIPVFMYLIASLADRLTRQQWTSLSRMSAHFLDVLQGLPTLKLLGRSREQIRTIAQISDRFGQTTLGVLKVAFLSALVMEMVATLSTAVVAVTVGLRLLNGRMGFQEAFFVLLLAPEFYLPLRRLGVRFHAGMSGVAAAQRIFEVLDEPKVEVKAEVKVKAKAEAALDLNLDLNLNGPSGAGKSTVAYLLLRFIQPDRGAITVDGVPLQDLPASVWRRQVAWVPQNLYLFHDSVAENIRLARPEASLDAVIWAARQAHAHAFIQALPDGYDTLVGERGTRLSGGQAQRIALARAFLKDAPMLILDEATANLDPEHETMLQETMERLMQDRTVLILAHRLSTVYRADQILVMDRGRVVESGTHAALLEGGQLYKQLVAAYSVS